MRTGDKITIVVLIIVASVFLLSYVLGSVLRIGETCYQIGECKKCFKPCFSEGCNNEKTEHNTIVETILCACEKASKNKYSDTKLNYEIVQFYKKRIEVIPVNDAEDVCEGGSIIKWE